MLMGMGLLLARMLVNPVMKAKPRNENQSESWSEAHDNGAIRKLVPLAVQKVDTSKPQFSPSSEFTMASKLSGSEKSMK